MSQETTMIDNRITPDAGWIDRMTGRVSFVCALIASLLVVAMMLLVVGDVLSRNILNAPISGVAGFVAYGVAASVFLQIGATIRNRRLIAAELFSGPLSQRAPGFYLGLQTFFGLAALVVMVFAAEYLWSDFLGSYTESEFIGATGAFRLYVWPFKLAVAFGASIAVLELVLQMGRGVLASTTGTIARRVVILAGAVAVLVAAIYILDILASMGLSRVGIGFAALGMLFALISLGMPIVFALMVTSGIGIWLVRDNLAVSINSVGNAASSAIRSYGYGVIPLFVLMGLLLERAGVGRDSFQIMALLVRRFTGGLGISTVGANAIFASITGSSVASATVFSRIAVPPMIEAGYEKKFALGIVAGSSVLGMLIPPSLLMIVYGLLAETSIGDMFIAGVIPGILLAGAFSLLIFGLARFAPKFSGQGARAGGKGPLTEDDLTRTEIAQRLGPVLFIVGLVMGGIYGGFFSPTEAGAVGAFGAVLVALFRRSLDMKSFQSIILETGAITAGLLFLMIAANLYGRMLTMTTIPMHLSTTIVEMSLSMIGFTLVYTLLVVLLGMILDSVSIMLIVLPIALPVITQMGGDLVWFGIITVIAIEIGLLTPPFGLSVYVVKGSLPPGFAKLGEIFAATTPFVIVMALTTLMIIFFPWLATALL